MLKKVLGLTIVTVGLGSYWAEAQTRKYVNEFLNVGAGARGQAMSGAQVATVGDYASGFWNPAGYLHINSDFQVGLMHSEYFAGISKYDFGSVGIPLKDKNRAVGITFLRFATDDIPNTLEMVNPDGSVDYSKIKSFSAADYSVLLSYAQRLNKDKLNGWNVLLGGNAKIIYRNVGSFANAWGVGIDAAVQAYKKGWYIGIMAKDITTTYTAWSFSFTDKEKEVLVNTGNILPSKSSEVTLPRLNMGVGRDFDLGKKFNLLTELDWDITTDGMRNTLIKSNVVSIDPKFGVEASYNKLIYLRAGIGNFQKALDDADTTNRKMITTFMPTIGVGVRLKSVCLEYAYTDLGNQSQALYSNVFSLRVDFNSKKKEKAKEQALPEKTIEKTQKF